MAFIVQGHSSKPQSAQAEESVTVRSFAAAPTGGDIAIDEQADFGYLHAGFDDADNYLPQDLQVIQDLDALGEMMIDQVTEANDGKSTDQTADSTLAPVLTYWGQFLDHELTARTDRESKLTGITDEGDAAKNHPPVHPPADSVEIEATLKNVRTPRFDLDSVYGGDPLGNDIPRSLEVDIATVISSMREPTHPAKMRIGTAAPIGSLPDNLDAQRDLPRFNDVAPAVRQAMLRIAAAQGSNLQNADLEGRALIGDMRNDENLIVAQFHLSFLRFHNSVVDFLSSENTGWVPDFNSAQLLTRLHYQWLIVEGYLKTICDPDVVNKVIDDRASHFFAFREDYDARRRGVHDSDARQVEEEPEQVRLLGNTLPLEFSVAAFRFGHTMVRNVYDYNNTFGRPDGDAPFEEIFNFTGGGGFRGLERVPKNWAIDWTRFLGTDPLDDSDGNPARFARSIDTELAPPLGTMIKEGEGQEFADKSEEVKRLFKHLAKRNLRRGYNLKIVTGQALHQHLKDQGALESDPIADVSTLFADKPEMQQLLQNSASGLHEKTPLWFYVLAEAEAAGGNSLGELGSWLVASTFIGVLLADPDSALSRGFEPGNSPLKMPDGTAIDSIEDWMRFGGVME